jgi:hypothetical protein
MTPLQPRTVPALRGWQWIAEGFRMLARYPLPWLLLCAVLWTLSSLLARVPHIGVPLTLLLTPLFLAGLMLACRGQEQGRAPQPQDLFAGFLTNAAALATAGGINMVAQIVIGGLVALIGAEHVGALDAAMSQPTNPEIVSQLWQRLMPLFLAAAALALPVVLIMWFTPALLVFNPMTAMQALQLSFIGCLRNVPALFLYSTVVFLLLALALLTPFAVGLLLLLPLLVTSAYASYKDVFSVNRGPQ